MKMKFDREKLFSSSYSHVYFYKDVTPESIVLLQKQLLEQTKPTVLHISSPGGYADMMKQIYNTISYLPVPVCTLVEGFCASAATMIALACEQRFCTNYSLTLLHQYSISNDGRSADHSKSTTRNDMLYNVEVLEEIHRFMMQIYQKRLNMKRREIDALLKTDQFLTSATCLDMGFYTDVIDLESNRPSKKKAGPDATKGGRRQAIQNLMSRSNSWMYVVHEPVSSLLKQFRYTKRDIRSDKVIMIVLPPLENDHLMHLLPLCAQLSRLPNKVYAVINSDARLATVLLSLFCDYSYIMSNVSVECGHDNILPASSSLSSEDNIANRNTIGELLVLMATNRRGGKLAGEFIRRIYFSDSMSLVSAKEFVDNRIVNKLITV